MFPGALSKPTIAVRLYDARDIARLEQKEGLAPPTVKDTISYLNQLNTAKYTASCNTSSSDVAVAVGNIAEPGQDEGKPKEEQQQYNNSKEDPSSMTRDWNSDIDELQQFRDSYTYPLVFFLLSPGEIQRRQLTQPYSFFQMVQRVLSRPIRIHAEPETQNEGSAQDNTPKMHQVIFFNTVYLYDVNLIRSCYQPSSVSSRWLDFVLPSSFVL